MLWSKGHSLESNGSGYYYSIESAVIIRNNTNRIPWLFLYDFPFLYPNNLSRVVSSQDDRPNFKMQDAKVSFQKSFNEGFSCRESTDYHKIRIGKFP